MGSRHRHPVRPAARRGLSLIELMVGTAVGLFVTAAASMMIATQLSENRRLLLETQLQQDLRAAADIITREMRRSGAWGQAYDGIWHNEIAAQPNPMSTVTVAGTNPANLQFSYFRREGELGPWGFQLTGGVIKSLVRTTLAWQDLTDPAVITVTSFTIATNTAPVHVVACPKLCADGTTACWPRLTVRDYTLSIAARSATDASVVRRLQTRVRPRNDDVQFQVPGTPALQACPA